MCYEIEWPVLFRVLTNGMSMLYNNMMHDLFFTREMNKVRLWVFLRIPVRVLKGIKKVVQVPIAQTTLMGNNSGLLVIVSGSSGPVLLVPKRLVVGGWWVVVVARV